MIRQKHKSLSRTIKIEEEVEKKQIIKINLREDK